MSINKEADNTLQNSQKVKNYVAIKEKDIYPHLLMEKYCEIIRERKKKKQGSKLNTSGVERLESQGITSC